MQNERASNYNQQRQQLIYCENTMQEMSTEMINKESQVRHAAEMYHQAATEQMTQRVTEEKEEIWTQAEEALANGRHRHAEIM